MSGFGDEQTGDASYWAYQRAGYAISGPVRIECGCFSVATGATSTSRTCPTNLTTLFCGMAFNDSTASVAATVASHVARAVSICTDGGSVIDWSYHDGTVAGNMLMNYMAFGL